MRIDCIKEVWGDIKKIIIFTDRAAQRYYYSFILFKITFDVYTLKPHIDIALQLLSIFLN